MGVDVGVGVGVGLGVGVGVAVAVIVGVGLGVAVPVGVGVLSAVGVEVSVSVLSVLDVSLVGVGVGVAVGVAVHSPAWICPLVSSESDNSAQVAPPVSPATMISTPIPAPSRKPVLRSIIVRSPRLWKGGLRPLALTTTVLS